MAEINSLLNGSREYPKKRHSQPTDCSSVELTTVEPGISLGSDEARTSTRSPPWKPSLWRHGPLLGDGALLLSVCCILAGLVVLLASDRRPVQEWNTSPSVYLSITTTACNTLIRLGLAQGVPVFWWRQALKGCRLGDLHRQWTNSRNLARALTSRHVLSPVALATFASTLLLLAGPLLQRASSVGTLVPEGLVNVEIRIAPELPSGWAGYVQFSTTNLIPSDAAKDALSGFLNQEPMTTAVSGCRGICNGTVRGPGLTKTCATSNRTYDIHNITTYPSFTDGHYVTFAVNLYGLEAPSHNGMFWYAPSGMPQPSELPSPDLDREVGVVGILRSDDDTLAATQCWVRSAILEYSVILRNNTITWVTAPSDPPFIALANNTANGSISVSTNSTTWASSVTIAMLDEIRPVFDSVLYMDGDWVLYQRDLGAFGSQHYRDSLQVIQDDLMASLNEIMFRAGLQAASPNQTEATSTGLDPGLTLSQNITGHRIDSVSVFFSDYGWRAGSSAVQLAVICLTLPLFWGYWQLGREVSFSPLELAKAFDAPLLAHVNSNANGEDVARGVDRVYVRYGALRRGDLPVDDADGRPHEKLGLAVFTEVGRPEKGQCFST